MAVTSGYDDEGYSQPADYSIGDAKQLDALELTEAEWLAEKERLAARLAKRRPPGFADWPTEGDA